MNPRALAIGVLARVEATEAYLNRVLEDRLASAPAHEPRDAAFATELCYGTTRRRRWLDLALMTRSDRRLETLEDRVLAALRIGAYQAFFMRVPRRAAVAETVEALRELGLERAVGFVNAVLRKVVEPEALPVPEGDGPARWAVEESHADWLVLRWVARFGAEATRAMLAADNLAPRVTVRANTSRVTREALLAELSGVGVKISAAPVARAGLVVEAAGRLEALFGYREGLWQVQDEAAQLVVEYADLPKHARVWDVCAAPGGKSCQLAEHHEVLATDLHAARLARVKAEAQRLGLEKRVATRGHDALHPLPSDLGAFDAVLLDAPCSGMGTLRRHPELRYRRLETDVPRLAELQARLLEATHRRVRAGGLLVYAVCSTEPEEGREQMERFLGAHPDFALEPPADPGRLPLQDGCLVTLPGPDAWDGFFAARLRRRAV